MSDNFFRTQTDNMRGVSALGRRAEPANADRNSMGVTAQLPDLGAEVRPVDRRTLEGSYNGQTKNFDEVGDVAAASLAQASGSDKCPRCPVGQFPLSGKQAPTSAPQSFEGADAIEQN